MLTLSCQLFMKLEKTYWMAISFSLLFCAVCQLLTFLLFNNPSCNVIRCQIGGGGAVSIAAAVFYILAGVAMQRINAPESECITFDFSAVAKKRKERSTQGPIIRISSDDDDEAAPAPSESADVVEKDEEKPE